MAESIEYRQSADGNVYGMGEFSGWGEGVNECRIYANCYVDGKWSLVYR